MARKFVDIGNDKSFASGKCLAANAFAKFDACASERSLKRTKNEVPVPCQIKADPEKIEGFFEDSGDICEIGDKVFFAGKQRIDLRKQFVINGFATGGLCECNGL